ncbi:MAG: hypothetical protein AAGF10_07020 [Verrucomicrobiota bacterium]
MSKSAKDDEQPLPPEEIDPRQERDEDEPEEERVEHFSQEFAQFFTQSLPDPQSWLGVGLDGTLAYSDGPIDPQMIGAPIADMVARVTDWIEHGHTVKVFTPRAADEAGVALVEAWLKQHGLPEMEVTCEKDLHMLELWDNRAIQVIANTGQPVGESRVERPRTLVQDEEKPVGEK